MFRRRRGAHVLIAFILAEDLNWGGDGQLDQYFLKLGNQPTCLTDSLLSHDSVAIGIARHLN